ncbi:hypothetical protein [Spirosoma rhododendri]|uniref:hypothetical protein n=1 Tax=Spirosoma rhododendri TaxID=2728024 RepID=UPI0020C4FAD5|nr:hypothetical protein [Spirosoma rhododendri]
MLADALFTTPFLDDLLNDETELRYMLAFESALAQVQAEVGDIPASAARAITDVCAQTDWRADIDYIRQQTPLAGNPAIPFVDRLRARVAETDAEAARYVHRGLPVRTYSTRC